MRNVYELLLPKGSMLSSVVQSPTPVCEIPADFGVGPLKSGGWGGDEP